MKRENNGEGTVLPDAQAVKNQPAAYKKAPPKRLVGRRKVKAETTPSKCRQEQSSCKRLKSVTTETIFYQGQKIDVELINYLSGVIPTSTEDMEGDEKLFRDEQGRYYLQRELSWIGINNETGRGERRASGRVHLHRVTTNTAILWATTRLNSETLALRRDAAVLLAGYGDSAHLHLPRTRGKRNSSMTAKECDPDMLLNVDLQPPYGERNFVALDAHVTKLLRARAEANLEDDPRDVVNGYLAAMLECQLFDSSRGGDELVTEARGRRLEREARQSRHTMHEHSVLPPATAFEAVAQRAVPPIDVSFGVTPAQYKLAQRAAVVDGLGPEDVDILALGALRDTVRCILSVQIGIGDQGAEKAWKKAGGTKSAKGVRPRTAVELDNLASAMLREACREGTDCLHPGEDPRDLINAAVTFYLCGDDNNRPDGFDLEISGEALERAKRTRLKLENGKGRANKD